MAQPERISGWHAGERAMQARAGVADRMADIAAHVLRDYMPEQHRAFFAQLPFLIAGSVDSDGAPWASVLTGPPGFVTSPDPRSLRIETLPPLADPLATALAPGAPVGLLGIDLASKRRNRANGRVAGRDAGGFSVAVEQSFGNCPKYIAARDLKLAPHPPPTPTAEPFETMPEEAWALLARTETAFVASGARGASGAIDSVDASHRGGPPGFLARGPGGAILLPDYQGNFFFNTLGNLATWPRLGLTVIDFASGDVLQLSGNAEVRDTDRLVRLRVTAGQWLRRGFAGLTL